MGKAVCGCGLVVCLLMAFSAALVCAPVAAAEKVTLTVLATTDVHGNIWPYDYLAGQPAERGLAKVSSYVKRLRARQPNLLVVDAGDSFQGTPLAYLAAEKYPSEPNPVVAAMNAIGYDAMASGNHEWNFGLVTLWRLKEQARFPLLAANVVSRYHDPVRDFEPYVIRTVGGVRVAILGMVMPGVVRREPPEHFSGYEFRDLVETAKRYLPRLRRQADLVFVIVHSGLGRDPKTFEPRAELFPDENRAWQLAEQVAGIDAIFFGHSHQELPGKEVNAALLVQAKYWAQSVGEAEFELEREAPGKPWRLTARRSRLVPMDASIPADSEILDLTRAAHERSEEYLNTVVGELDHDLDARSARIEDHPLVELLQRAQLHYGEAEVSLAELYSTNLRLRAGPVTIRDLYALYPYENRLFTVELTGAQLKEALEQSARSFNSFPWPEGGSPFVAVPVFGYDMAEGVSYKLDLARPAGERVVDLRFQGAPLDPARRLRVALNSYRWAGGGGFEMLRHARIVHRAPQEVRELLIDFVQAEKRIPTVVDNNWEILPAAARDAALPAAPGE